MRGLAKPLPEIALNSHMELSLLLLSQLLALDLLLQLLETDGAGFERLVEFFGREEQAWVHLEILGQ